MEQFLAIEEALHKLSSVLALESCKPSIMRMGLEERHGQVCSGYAHARHRQNRNRSSEVLPHHTHRVASGSF